MKNKLTIFLSLVLIAVGGFCVGLFFRNKSQSQILLIDDFVGNEKTIAVNSGAKYSEYLKINNNQALQPYAYYYDKELTKPVDLDSQITSNATIFVGYIQQIETLAEIKQGGVAGICYSGNIDNSSLKSLCEFAYVEISTVGQLQFDENNTKTKVIKIFGASKVEGINNFSSLEKIELSNVQQLKNCFNNCSKLFDISSFDVVQITNSLNNCKELSQIKFSSNLQNIESSFQKTPLETINAESNLYYQVKNNILYKVSGDDLVLQKASKNSHASSIDSQTIEIEDYAFYDTSLSNLKISAHVSRIGKHAFEKSKISSLDLSQNYNILVIDEYAFANTDCLLSVNFGNLIKEIKNRAFVGSAVQNLNLQQCSVLSFIGDYAFAQNNNLQSATLNGIKINNGTNQTEPKGLFSECSKLTSVQNINFNNITLQMFYGCKSLNSLGGEDITEKIDNLAFCGCTNLQDISILTHASEIGAAAFEDCSKISSISFLNVLKVNQKAFCGCTALVSATFGETLEFDFSAFDQCDSLQNLQFIGGNFVVDEGAVYNTSQTQLLFYLANSEEQTFVIKSSVEAIENKYLSQAKNLKEILSNSANFASEDGVLYDVTTSKVLVCYPQAKEDQGFEIDSSVRAIKQNAFYKCPKLKTLIVATEVETIEKGALKNLESLVNLTVGFLGQNSSDSENSYVGWIFGASSHYYNKDFLPSSLRVVNVLGESKFCEGAFMYCDNLYEVKITHITKVEKNMFYGCTKLQTVRFEKGIQQFKDYVFYGCKSLVNIYLIYYQDIVVSTSAFLDMSQNPKVVVVVPSSITSQQIVDYKSKFNKLWWTWETKYQATV